MSTLAPSPPPPTPRPTRRFTTPRIAALLAAGVLAVLAIGMFAAGGASLYADTKKDDRGFISTAAHGFAGTGYAVATDDLDVNGVPSGVVGDVSYGKVRLQVTPRAGKPVFVGIARTESVSAYLRRSPHSILTDVSFDPFRADYRAHAGTEKPFSPGAQRFWAVSSEGQGRRTITWNVRGGHWSIVVMNADGSRGVDAGVRAGARVPALPYIGWGALGIGLVLLAGAGGLTVLGLRRPR
ncbi:MAG: hypothetical protein ABI950_05005 [Solirubrobacteraceae bacterium]